MPINCRSPALEPWSFDAITARSWRLLRGDHILETNNAGKTWKTITTNHRFPALSSPYSLPTPFALFDSGGTGWVVQQNIAGISTIWRTADDGTHWHHVTIPGT